MKDSIRNPNPTDPLTFKFRWMHQGNVAADAALAGSFDGRQLTLDDQTWPLKQVGPCFCDQPVLSSSVYEEKDEQWYPVVISVTGQQAETLKRVIDAARSKQALDEEQKQLIEQGQGDSFRSELCPHCDASISLSKFADSPQGYCNYCQTLFTFGDGQRPFGTDPETLDRELEPKYRLCDHCEMYSRPTKFRIFYFVFLVYHMHFSSDTTVRCPGCMRWEAWKMLCGNLFGLLGLPLAFTQLVRSYRSRIEKGPLRGLDDANRLANRGKIDRALDRYDRLMDNLPINAGIKFNIGSGLLKKEDPPHAESMFLLALEDCANYEPALYGLAECYRRLGKTKELAGIEFQLSRDHD